jgi:pPIWI_RE three-gene island domain Y
MTAEDARRAPWRGDWDEVVLRLLSSGVADLADHVASGQPVRLPYPVSLQRALDRLSVMCIASGKQPPRSVADLLRWCQLPLGKWEMPLAGDEADDATCLIVGGQPSRECLEWAIAASDVEGEFREQRVVYEALDVCRANGRPDVYVAFRELLISKPTMSELDLATELDRPEFLGGCDLWEGWDSWHHGSSTPLGCGNVRWRWSSSCVRRRAARVAPWQASARSWA